MDYTSFWRRGAAAIIDGIILSAISALCMRLVVLLPFAFILHFFYKPIFESSNVRATPGKYLAEISVVRSNGDKLSLKDAYIRYFASWVSGLMLGLGYLCALFTKKNQTLHDLFADTVVVNKVYESNGLWNEWVDQMKFMFARKTKNIDIN
ncbi:MAG: RDD family protein [Bacteriovorax sp.]|nr:RDD family protein [Bacteriovorax sp.]